MATVEKDLGLVVGSTGPAGKDAKISSATGRITPGHKSVPTVSVVVGGESGNQTLDFTFDGIQGEEGSDATVPVATTAEAGKVKPDGTSITVDTSGTIKVGQVAATSLTGTVPLSNLPQGALERIVTVADETARFQLTTSTVQLGDIVQQLDTKVMYVVVDESKLTEASGYTEFSAATATKALEADHAKSSDNATNSTDSTYAGYVNYHKIEAGIDLNTLRGTEKAGVYYKSSDTTNIVNVPANVDPAMEAILEVIPLSTEGITEQRYTTMGLQEKVHLYVRHTDAAGNWQGWVTIGPQAAVGEASHAENADNAHLANVANQLGSVNVGTDNRPIYLDQGNPKPLSGNAGDFETPIYLNGGSFDTISKVADSSHSDNADNATQADRATTANNLSGILSVDHGGTGVNDLNTAANSFINALTDEVGDPQDDDFFISQSSGGKADTYHRRKFSALWNWIDTHMADIEIGNARTADTAVTANQLNVGGVGSSDTPVYFDGGVPVAIEKVKAALNADNATNAESAQTASTLGTSSVGDDSTPIYLENGVPTPIAQITYAEVADTLGTNTVGGVESPIYLENGVPKVASLSTYTKKSDFPELLKTNIDALPARDIAEDDYIIIQAEGAATARAKIGVSTTDEFGIVTTEDIATASKVGLVKPDGTSIKITSDGTISVDKIDTATLVTKDEFASLLQSNIETIRTALGLATTERNGLVPKLPASE